MFGTDLGWLVIAGVAVLAFIVAADVVGLFRERLDDRRRAR